MKDSSDDYWFLEDEEEEQEGVSVKMDGISLAIKSESDPPVFEEEYEIESGTDHDLRLINDDDDTDDEVGILVLTKMLMKYTETVFNNVIYYRK